MLKEMKKKDIAICIVLIAFSLITIVSCNSKYQESVEERKSTVRTAVKVKDNDLFDYALETRQGNIVATGEVKAVDPVKFAEMNQEFFFVEKTIEHYVMKTRVVTYTDSKGKTQTKTETYWEWDVVSSEKVKSKKLLLLSKEYPTNKFELTNPKSIEARKILDKGDFRFNYHYLESDVRISYEVIPTRYETTFLAKAGDNGLESINKNKINLSNISYQSFMDRELKDSILDKFIFILAIILIPIIISIGYLKIFVLDEIYIRRRY